MNKEIFKIPSKKEAKSKIIEATSLNNFALIFENRGGKEINVEGVLSVKNKKNKIQFLTRVSSQTLKGEILIFNELHQEKSFNLGSVSYFEKNSYDLLKLFVTAEKRLIELQKILPNVKIKGPADRMDAQKREKTWSDVKNKHVNPYSKNKSGAVST